MELANHMDEVAKIFGMKLGDVFEVSIVGEVKRLKCKITDQGLYIWQDDWQEWDYDHGWEVLIELLTGGAWVHEA